MLGEDVTINSSREDTTAVVGDLSGGLAADVVIEAVGSPPVISRVNGRPQRHDHREVGHET